MPLLTIKYLQYVTGPGRSRQPRMPMPGAYPPGLGTIPCYIQQPPNTLTPVTAFTAPYPIDPAGLPCIPGYKFAFQSVTGLEEGGLISTDILSPCAGTVGTEDVVVLNVYVPAGGGTGPAGENGAVIDAFNVETGNFCDDDFVTVVPDSGGALTTSGNVLGWVNSQGGNLTVTAYSYISPSNKYFQRWEIVPGTGNATDSVSGSALMVGQNTNPFAFAFYTGPKKNFFKEFLEKPRKDLEKEIPKNWKDAAYEFRPWDIYSNPVDERITGLIEKISGLEKQIQTLGQAFIRLQERPEVGKEIAKKGGKS